MFLVPCFEFLVPRFVFRVPCFPIRTSSGLVRLSRYGSLIAPISCVSLNRASSARAGDPEVG